VSIFSQKETLQTSSQVESSHRAIKRMRLEIDGLRSECGPDEIVRPASPSKALRTPQRGAPMVSVILATQIIT
jgi:hypothetical protein